MPGGIGVRELVVIPLLAPRFDPVAAIVAAVLLRIVWMAAEVLAAAILYFALPGSSADSRAEETQPVKAET